LQNIEAMMHRQVKDMQERCQQISMLTRGDVDRVEFPGASLQLMDDGSEFDDLRARAE
jgi:hypothetical protein